MNNEGVSGYEDRLNQYLRLKFGPMVMYLLAQPAQQGSKLTALDLLIQLSAIGDQQHTSVLDVLANPLGQPDHREALAGALGMPDDAAFAPPHEPLCFTHPKVLVVATEFLGPGIVHNEVMHQFQEALMLIEGRTVMISGTPPALLPITATPTGMRRRISGRHITALPAKYALTGFLSARVAPMNSADTLICSPFIRSIAAERAVFR